MVCNLLCNLLNDFPSFEAKRVWFVAPTVSSSSLQMSKKSLLPPPPASWHASVNKTKQKQKMYHNRGFIPPGWTVLSLVPNGNFPRRVLAVASTKMFNKKTVLFGPRGLHPDTFFLFANTNIHRKCRGKCACYFLLGAWFQGWFILPSYFSIFL